MFCSCSAHTKLFWVVLFVFVYNAAEIGWLDIFKIENWCLLREWGEQRRTLLAGNMGHAKDNLLLWRMCWTWWGEDFSSLFFKEKPKLNCSNPWHQQLSGTEYQTNTFYFIHCCPAISYHSLKIKFKKKIHSYCWGNKVNGIRNPIFWIAKQENPRRKCSASWPFSV